MSSSTCSTCAFIPLYAQHSNTAVSLEPEKFNDLAGYKTQFETLDKERVGEVQEMLKPHFLRRTKEMVLDLPPLNSIIVRLSLRPLQKRVNFNH